MRTQIKSQGIASDIHPGDVFEAGTHVYLRVKDMHNLIKQPYSSGPPQVLVVDLHSGELVILAAGTTARPVNGVFEER